MKRRRICSYVVFLAVAAALLFGVSRVMEYKGSREKIAPFMECADQCDVLFFGDSHAYSDIYPMELWEDYGITAYNLASYNHTIPMSYWVMRNALRVCKPEVIVLDVNEIWEQEKLCESSSDVHIGLDGFPLTRTKVEAIFDLMDDPLRMDKSGKRYVDLRPEFLFPFIKYHARWSELTPEDLRPNYDKELGGERNIAVAVPDSYEITADAADEEGYGFIYLRRFIEYCQGAGIRLLLTNLPYPCRNNHDEQLYTNAVVYTAEEYGVEYIDFVYMDQIADYSTDCYDPGSHLNPSGAWKTTDFLGQCLSQEYGVRDHRKDAAYASWHERYAVYRERKLQSLQEETEPYSFLMLLADPSFSAAIFLPAGSNVQENELAVQLLQNAGRRHLMMEDVDEAVWSDSLMPLERVMESGEGYTAVIDRQAASVQECVGNGTVQTSFGSVVIDPERGILTVNGTTGSVQLTAQEPYLFAAVLDKQTGEVLYERRVRL